MTKIMDLAGAPAVVNDDESGLGPGGTRIRLVCGGDDELYWTIGERAPAPGVPGFPIRRGGAHEISLPDTGRLWAWSGNRSRLIAMPVGDLGKRGTTPEVVDIVTLGQTPIIVPLGNLTAPAGKTFTVMNTGAKASFFQTQRSRLPDPLVAAWVQENGEAVRLQITPADDPREVWAWTDSHQGSVLLIVEDDAGWNLG